MNANRSTRTSTHKKGVALLLTMFSLVLLSVIGFGLIAVSTAQSRMTMNLQEAQRAYYLARIGLGSASDFITNNFQNDQTNVGGTSPAITQDPPYPIPDYTPIKVGDTANPMGTYNWAVWASPSNATSNNKCWKIIADGVSQGGAHRRLQAWVSMTATFADYAYFSDMEIFQNGQPAWFTSGEVFEGHLFTNGYFNIAGTPVFFGPMESANMDTRQTPAVREPLYYKITPTPKYSQGGTTYTNLEKFYHCYSGSYKNDYPTFPAPKLSDKIEEPLPDSYWFVGAQPLVTMPTTVKPIQEHADKSYTYDIKIHCGADGYVSIYKANIYRDSNNCITSYSPGVFIESVPSKPSLTIHTTGAVLMYSGVVEGKLTVGADREILLKGDLRCNYRKNPTTDKTIDTIGLVSKRSINLMTDPTIKRDIYIDAAMMILNGGPEAADPDPATTGLRPCIGSFTVGTYCLDNDGNPVGGKWNYTLGIDRGKINLRGAIVQRFRGAVGTYLQNAGKGATGYAKNFRHDPNLTTNSPTNFPLTGKINIMTIQDSGSI